MNEQEAAKVLRDYTRNTVMTTKNLRTRSLCLQSDR